MGKRKQGTKIWLEMEKPSLLSATILCAGNNGNEDAGFYIKGKIRIAGLL